MKHDRISIRLDANMSFEIQELCKEQKAPLSTMVRALLILGINEIRNKTNTAEKGQIQG